MDLDADKLPDPSWGRRICWVTAAAIPTLWLFAELLPVVFGKGYQATWDWSFLYVTIRFVALPIGGPIAGLFAIWIGWNTGPRTWRRLLPAIVLLGFAIAYDVVLFLWLS
jgi:hypothetical protein